MFIYILIFHKIGIKIFKGDIENLDMEFLDMGVSKIHFKRLNFMNFSFT